MPLRQNAPPNQPRGPAIAGGRGCRVLSGSRNAVDPTPNKASAGRIPAAGARTRGRLASSASVAIACTLAMLLGAVSGSWSDVPLERRQESEEPVRICRWYGGKKAAISLRFDDSHPSHIESALPLLNEHGLIGTFLVCPGGEWYEQYRDAWERAVVEGGHELANHTMTHRGAQTDEDAERQIGEAARLIRAAQVEPQLLAFQRGGGTQWFQRKPMAYFAARHDLWDVDAPENRNAAQRTMSCSEEYSWFSVEAFCKALDSTIEAGGWMQPHFHCIGEGYLTISPEAFRGVLEAVASRHSDLWNAGLSAIHQYEHEHESSAVFVHARDDDTLVVSVACATDAELYTQPLTTEVDLPDGGGDAYVTNGSGEVLKAVIASSEKRRLLRWDVPPRDADYEVHAEGIGASYGGAHDFRPPDGHPYVFFSSDDVGALVGKQSDPTGRQMWEAIEERARRLLAEPPPEPGGDRRTGRARSRAERARALLFYYALTRDSACAPAIVGHVEALLADDAWRPGNCEMLVTAAGICTLGLAYDWAHDVLSDDLKARVREAIVEHGIGAVTAATDDSVWWTRWPRGNWGEVIYGQVGVAALALLSEEPKAADCARLCERKIWHYVQAIGRNGGWGESGSYALYGWSNGIMFMDALRRTMGRDLFDSPRLRELPEWLITLREPDGRNFVPFSNCGPWTQAMPGILYRLADEYGDGRGQSVGVTKTRQNPWADIFGFLWYAPKTEARPVAELPLSKVFRGIDWGMLRNRWEDPEATLFALKGGQKDWDHYHHDTNSFVLYAHGRPLIIDLMYPHELWGCRTEAHNTVMVNGRDQRGEVRVAGMRGDPDHRGIVSDLLDAGWYARLVGDATPAYEPDDVKSFVREVMYLRNTRRDDPPDYFVLFDDVDALRAAQIEWLLHTYGDLTVEGNSVSIVQDAAAVDVTMVAPQPLELEVSSKNLDEIRVLRPFESADVVSMVKARPAERVARGRLVSVLVPRRSSEPPAVALTGIDQPNVLGAAVRVGSVSDVALFALDSPAMEIGEIEAVGRSCFVRREGGRVAAAALHGGSRLSIGGDVLFETSGSGHVALWFSDGAIDAALDLYEGHDVAVHTDRPPSTVIVDGKERDFAYDADRKCVRLNGRGAANVSILYE